MHAQYSFCAVGSLLKRKCGAVTLPIFLLSELVELYGSRLTELGVEVNSRINTTKLKNRLLAYLPDMHAQYSGKHILLAFDMT